MNIYGIDFFNNDELVAEIKAYAKARRDLMTGSGVVIIRGEGRWLEFTRPQSGDLDTAIREMLYEARQRGLSIGGNPGSAIEVEIG